MKLVTSAKQTVFLALLCGALLRIVLYAGLKQDFNRGDASQYDRMALHLAVDGLFSDDIVPPFHPTMVRAPLYPLFLAAIYKVFGHFFLLAIGLQIILSLATGYLLAETIASFSKTLGLLVLWLAVLNPFDAVYSITLLSETLTTFWLVVGICLPFLWPRTASWWLAGLALGLACLTRDVYVLLIPLVGLSLICFALFSDSPNLGFSIEKKNVWRGALLIAIGGGCAILPWTVRNRLTTGESVLISKGIFGQALWIGTWETNAHWFDSGRPDNLPPESCRNPEECAEVKRVWNQPWGSERDQALKKLAFARLQQEPMAIFVRWLIRLPRSWLGTRYEIFTFRPHFLARGKPLWWVIKAGLYGLNTIIIGLGLVGLVLAAKRKRLLLWFAMPVIYTIAIYFSLHNLEIRYTQPAYPFLLVFTAVGVLYCYERFTKGSQTWQ